MIKLLLQKLCTLFCRLMPRKGLDSNPLRKTNKMSQTTEPVVRLSRPNDITQLRDLDLKCFQYPFSMAEWQHFIQGSGKKNEPKVMILEVLKKAVGFAMWEANIQESHINVFRVGVLPLLRRRKLGTALISTIVKDAKINHMDKIKCIVPDIHCTPNDPDDVSEFLLHNGFSATGEIVYGIFGMYGSNVDGYTFEKGIF